MWRTGGFVNRWRGRGLWSGGSSSIIGRNARADSCPEWRPQRIQLGAEMPGTESSASHDQKQQHIRESVTVRLIILQQIMELVIAAGLVGEAQE